jgi:hypothetical protein
MAEKPPLGVTVGWYLLHDPEVRARRRALGLWIPDADIEGGPIEPPAVDDGWSDEPF